MGTMYYGGTAMPIRIDDRALAHLKVVVATKLRRNESFGLSIERADGGRSTVWISPSSTLQFRFDSATHEINRQWLDELIDSANTTTGMRILPEPDSAPAA